MALRVHVAAAVLVLGLGSGAGRATACTSNAECNDGNACNGSEACQAGMCIAGTPITCDDSNPCTVDACDPLAGCTSTPSDGCVVPGKKLRLGSSGDLRLGMQTGPQMIGPSFPANFSDDDPVLHGASLRVYTTAGDGFDNLYALPSASWEYVKTPGANVGYAYHDFHGVSGPVTLAVIRQGKPGKIKARGIALGFTLHTDPTPVDVVLRFGNAGRHYCLEFGGRTRFSADARFTAVAAAAPSSCP